MLPRKWERFLASFRQKKCRFAEIAAFVPRPGAFWPFSSLHHGGGAVIFPSYNCFSLPVNSKENTMSEHVYKIIELVGSSKDGIEPAIRNAISRAGSTVRNMRWFEVAETRGYLENDDISYWQVRVRVGFTLDK